VIRLSGKKAAALPLLALLLALSIMTSMSQEVNGNGLDIPGITSPVLKDTNGKILNEGSSGVTTIVSLYAVNSRDIPLPFVAVIEARSEDGVTWFLDLQEGQAPPGDSTEVTTSWTPERTGDYELRTFLISGFENPTILTGVQSSNIVIK
jgi:hypothetical protein